MTFNPTKDLPCPNCMYLAWKRLLHVDAYECASCKKVFSYPDLMDYYKYSLRSKPPPGSYNITEALNKIAELHERLRLANKDISRLRTKIGYLEQFVWAGAKLNQAVEHFIELCFAGEDTPEDTIEDAITKIIEAQSNYHTYKPTEYEFTPEEPAVVYDGPPIQPPVFKKTTKTKVSWLELEEIYKQLAKPVYQESPLWNSLQKHELHQNLYIGLQNLLHSKLIEEQEYIIHFTDPK